MPKRICIIDQGEIFGGAECFALDIIRMLPKDEFEVHVCISKNAHTTYRSALQEIYGVTVHEITIPQLKPISIKTVFQFLHSCISFWNILRKTKAEVLYTNTIRAHIVGSVVSLMTRVPMIWIVHDFTFPRVFMKSLIRIPRRVVGVSEVVLEYIRDCCGERWNSKLVVIPNGVVIEKNLTPTLTVLQDIDQHSFQFEEGKKYIGIIGRIDIWKGQDIFLKAVKYLKEQYSEQENVEFVIIGGVTDTDDDRREYAKSIRMYAEKEVLDNVRFLGHQKLENVLPRLYLLIQSSTAPEPFGRTVIEAFQAGIPVIASNIGALKTIITYGHNGLTFEAGNPQDLAQKIALLIEDKHLYNTLKVNAERDVRAKYSMQRVLEMFMEVIQGVISK